MEVVTDNLVPVITIQCDWEDFIELPHKQVWVACKFRNQSSIHGYIRGGTATCDSDKFTVTLGRNSLCVKYNPNNQICRFIPAFKVFTNIHLKAILSVDVADGGLGVSSCASGKLIVWDNTTGEVRRELIGHKSEVCKCKLFPSGIVILSASYDMRLKIWSAETGQCPVTLTGHTKAITDISIIDRGRNVLSVSKDGTARLWLCGEAACLDTILNTSAQLSCCAVGKVPEGIETSDNQKEKEFGTEDKILLVGSEEGEIYAVVLGTRQILYAIKVDSAVNAILHFSQIMFIVGTQDGQLLSYNLKDGSLLRIIHESNSPVQCLAQYQDKGVLVGRHDGTVNYYNLLSDTQDRIQLTGPDCDPVYSIAVTTNAVFTGCRDGKIRKYKVSDLIAGGI